MHSYFTEPNALDEILIHSDAGYIFRKPCLGFSTWSGVQLWPWQSLIGNAVLRSHSHTHTPPLYANEPTGGGDLHSVFLECTGTSACPTGTPSPTIFRVNKAALS